MDDKFFLGYRKTAVNPEEVLISVLLPFTVKVSATGPSPSVYMVPILFFRV